MPEQSDHDCRCNDGGDRHRDRDASCTSATSEGQSCRRPLAERGVLPQYLLLEIAEPRGGLDAELLEQMCSTHTVGLERLSLAATAIERHHQQREQILACRVLSHQPFQLAEDVPLAPACEIRLDPQFNRLQALVLQPLGRRPCPLLVLQLSERRPAPELESSA